MSKLLITLEEKESSFHRSVLQNVDIDLLFGKQLVKDNFFDLNELSGSFNEYPQYIRLVGHLKRWNMSVNKGQKTNQKELDLFNNLYSNLRCIRYEIPSVQQKNLIKLQQWFLLHFQKHKTIQFQIKNQNLDFENKNRLFRNRQAHENLKYYNKPYQICLKLFEEKIEKKKSQFQKQNESIQRLMNRRGKQEIQRFIEHKQQKQMLKTVQQFNHSRAKRRMINSKIQLRKRGKQSEQQNEIDQNSVIFPKWSKSVHAQGFDQISPVIVPYGIKRLNKTSFAQFRHQIEDTNNVSIQSLKLETPILSKNKKDKTIVKNEAKRSQISTSMGYRLMVNPFIERQTKSKKRKR